MSEKSSFEGFISGLFVGLIVGGVLGILFAPQSGEETQKILKEKTKDLEVEIKEKMAEIKEKGRDFLTKEGIELQESKENL